ncbi:MAG TPA: malto-oligosyltrehalose synthase [Paracoccaceae bacterium]|nr:malto-oligosyltrehalose synthase [Paracoccaceae bacterium]
MRELRATCRLQFHAGFTFADAEGLVPYLAELGISHLYASPIFAARPGSMHGYDVIDPTRLNPELGTEAGFASLVAALHRAGMGLIIDIVPNHMAIARGNRLLQEALCLGPESEAARIFDIDWGAEQVAMPFLGGPIEEVLGEIRLERDPDGLVMAVCHDNAFALRPGSIAQLAEAAGLDPALAEGWRALEESPEATGLVDAMHGFAQLGAEAAAALDRVLAAADLVAVLAEQRWRLTDWRSAAETLNHRRFFNITELIGVRAEDPWVFERTHRLALDLVRRGDVDGLRIDHVDGLADPAGYCRTLREAVGPDVPIFVEKILGPHEVLPDWPVDGTTGYERLNEINRLFVDAGGYAALDGHLVASGLLGPEFRARLAAAKRQVLDELFAPEVAALAALAAKLGTGLDQGGIGAAIRSLLVHFPVYRSYAGDGWSADDTAHWREALTRILEFEGDEAAARAQKLFDALGEGEAARDFVTRFQQLSGPAMAKGLEDTELYRSVALASVNEVGGEPEVPAATPGVAHRAVEARVARGDRSLIPLATHDTKRGPETRARINTLSHDAAAWIGTSRRWSELGRAIRTSDTAPDALDEWLIHQTLVGAWPITADRLTQYLEKAMREAKRHTRWEAPDEAYEGAVRAYAEALLEGKAGRPLRDAVADHVAGLEMAARTNAIAQTVLQLAWPGVPDIYQGTELWDRSLVDPDNRRPVDWDLRRRLLAEEGMPPLAEDEEGVTKLRVTASLLDLRRRHPGLLVDGAYRPLPQGDEAVFAFLRAGEGRELLIAVPLRGRAARVEIAEDLAGSWTDVVRGGAVDLAAAVDLAPDWPFLILLR